MRRLLKMGRVFSCNLERKIINNVRKNRMGDPESEIFVPESSTRDFLLSFLLSPLLSSPLLSFLCVRATFGIALSKFTGNPCDVCLALRATRENGTFASRLLMRLVIISFFLSTTFYVTRFLVAVSALSLSLSLLSQGRERVEGNKRIKKI